MTTTKERPILFSAPMVRAILAGRKTMTRRIVNPQPFVDRSAQGFNRVTWWPTHAKEVCGVMSPIAMWRDDMPIEQTGAADIQAISPFPCKSRLWVRETWGDRGDYAHIGKLRSDRVYYAADGKKSGWKYRPSIYMPRWASRITLQVEAVRVERLQDITGQDVKAEGCEPDWEAFEEATCDKEGWDEPEEFDEECEVECDWVNYGRRLVETREHKEWEADRANYALRLAFRKLWTSLNGDDSWDANPWVWVVSFSVVKP